MTPKSVGPTSLVGRSCLRGFNWWEAAGEWLSYCAKLLQQIGDQTSIVLECAFESSDP